MSNSSNVHSSLRNGLKETTMPKKLSMDEINRLIKSRTKLDRYFNAKGVDRNSAWEMVLQDCQFTGITPRELAFKWRGLHATYKMLFQRMLPKKNQDQKVIWPYYAAMHEFATKYQTNDEKLDNELDEQPVNTPNPPVSTSAVKAVTLNRETPKESPASAPSKLPSLNKHPVKRSISRDSPTTAPPPAKRSASNNGPVATPVQTVKLRGIPKDPKSSSTPNANSTQSTSRCSTTNNASSNESQSKSNQTNDDTVILSDEEEGVTEPRRNGEYSADYLDRDSPEAMNKEDAKIDAFIDDLQKRTNEMSKKFNKTCEAISKILKEKFDVQFSDSSETE